MSYNTMLFALYRMGYHGRATVHGFPAMASTALNEMGFRSDVVERQLAAQSRSCCLQSRGYLGDRRAMMNRWADYLDGHAGENVVHFKTIA